MSGISFNFFFLYVILKKLLLALFHIITTFLILIDLIIFVAALTFFIATLMINMHIFSNQASQDFLFLLFYLYLRCLRLFCYSISLFLPSIETRFWYLSISF